MYVNFATAFCTAIRSRICQRMCSGDWHRYNYCCWMPTKFRAYEKIHSEIWAVWAYCRCTTIIFNHWQMGPLIRWKASRHCKYCGDAVRSAHSLTCKCVVVAIVDNDNNKRIKTFSENRKKLNIWDSMWMKIDQVRVQVNVIYAFDGQRVKSSIAPPRTYTDTLRNLNLFLSAIAIASSSRVTHRYTHPRTCDNAAECDDDSGKWDANERGKKWADIYSIWLHEAIVLTISFYCFRF